MNADIESRYMLKRKFYVKSWLKHALRVTFVLSFLTTPSWAFQDEKGAAEGSQTSAQPAAQTAAQPASRTAAKHDSQTSALCRDGFAFQFPCKNVHLVSFLPLSEIGTPIGGGVNDAWGWEDPDTQKTYALIGRKDGVAFVDVSVPEAPVYVGELLRTLNTPPTTWRDVKVDGYYAFVVADGTGSGDRHGMQVFDLRRLRSFSGSPTTYQADALYDDFTMAHNIAINEESHRAYIVGSRGAGQACGGGLHIVDISDPLLPTFLGCFADPSTGRSGTGYSHDTQCVIYRGPDTTKTGREICVSSNETAISIADVTNPSLPVIISKAAYPNSGYVHQGWFTEDQRYFVQNDELDERAFGGTTSTMIWDLSVLREPELLKIFESDIHSIDHNLYIREGLAYQANYSSGLRILDVRTPSEPEILAWFDTTPDISTVTFDGTWTAYPYPGKNIVILTSRNEGLFIVQPSNIVGTRFQSNSAEVLGGEITFRWTMSSEKNVVRYDIERLKSNNEYEVAATVPAIGGLGDNRAYESSFSLAEGVYHFRLVAYSGDEGTISTKDQTVVSMSGGYLLEEPYPNPVTTTARTSIAVRQSQNVQINLYDLRGRRVLRVFEGHISEGVQIQLQIDATGLSGGVYFLRTVGEKFVTTSELVVVR